MCWRNGDLSPGTALLQMVASPQTRAQGALSQGSQQSLGGVVGADKPQSDTQAINDTQASAGEGDAQFAAIHTDRPGKLEKRTRTGDQEW